jgi:hypothetical protein
MADERRKPTEPEELKNDQPITRDEPLAEADDAALGGRVHLSWKAIQPNWMSIHCHR